MKNVSNADNLVDNTLRGVFETENIIVVVEYETDEVDPVSPDMCETKDLTLGSCSPLPTFIYGQ